MKAVRNVFLICALVVVASSSFAQEVKRVEYNPETNKLIEQRNHQPQKHPKHKKLRSDLQHSKAKPIKIESRIYNESN
jgi:hypothetical protein